MAERGRTITEKIIESHLKQGKIQLTGIEPGQEIKLEVDATLVHDMSGTLAYIGFEAMGIEKIQTPLSITFQDHNLVAMDHKSLDDHRFVQSAARRYGAVLSKAGNGICHSLYYSRFGRPGTLLAGADSHSATAGAVGMLGIGLGGLDVSAIMGGEPLTIKMPGIIGVEVKGKLRPGVSAKDAALWLLKELTVKGCVGKVLEYMGEGLKNLTVPQRATIANMGAEMGATSSVFPADEMVRQFLKAQEREEDFTELKADQNASYERILQLDLRQLEPFVAVPPMPDRVMAVKEAGRIPVNQVFIGSCTNGSYYDLARAAKVLEGKKVHPEVSLLVAPSSRQVYEMLLEDGSISTFLKAGARIMECGCGPCIGLGQAPSSGGISIRTSNRNYKGRSGTIDASLYLTGTETAAASAVTGYLTSAADVMENVEVLDQIQEPEHYLVDDSLLYRYDKDSDCDSKSRDCRPLIKGPNIKVMPVKGPLDDEMKLKVSLKTGDNITTDDIIPPSPEVLTLRPNIPALSEHVFEKIDAGFAKRAKAYGTSVIVGGENYGQGSSREHAAIAPMYLGVRVVLAKSLSRIHRSNLINYGILPVIFENQEDYEWIKQGDEIEAKDIIRQAEENGKIHFRHTATGKIIDGLVKVSENEWQLLKAGGLLPWIRKKHKEGNA